jgi:hypothetical protein
MASVIASAPHINALKAGDLFDERGRYRQAGDILQNAASLLGLPPDAAASPVKMVASVPP